MVAGSAGAGASARFLHQPRPEEFLPSEVRAVHLGKAGVEAVPVCESPPLSVGEVGRLRLSVPRTAVPFVIDPVLPTFRARHPRVEVEVVVEERFVDIVAEGYDAGVRLSEAIERDMVQVRLTEAFRFAVVGAPEYLARHGTPERPEDLLHHKCITFRSQTTGALYAWELERGRRSWRVPVRGGTVTNDHMVTVSLAAQGLGLAHWSAPKRPSRASSRCSKPSLGLPLARPRRRALLGCLAPPPVRSIAPVQASGPGTSVRPALPSRPGRHRHEDGVPPALVPFSFRSPRHSTSGRSSPLAHKVVAYPEAHVGGLGADAELAEQPGEMRIGLLVEDDEAGVHRPPPPVRLDVVSVGVSPYVVPGIEEHQVVARAQVARTVKPRDARPDDGDPHGSSTRRHPALPAAPASHPSGGLARRVNHGSAQSGCSSKRKR
jgi:hypothetical protein